MAMINRGRQHSLLSPLDYLPAKAGGAVNGGAYAPFILTVDWLGWFCYIINVFLINHLKCNTKCLSFIKYTLP